MSADYRGFLRAVFLRVRALALESSRRSEPFHQARSGSLAAAIFGIINDAAFDIAPALKTLDIFDIVLQEIGDPSNAKMDRFDQLLSPEASAERAADDYETHIQNIAWRTKTRIQECKDLAGETNRGELQALEDVLQVMHEEADRYGLDREQTALMRPAETA
jgi:hypothetical protein